MDQDEHKRAQLLHIATEIHCAQIKAGNLPTPQKSVAEASKLVMSVDEHLRACKERKRGPA